MSLSIDRKLPLSPSRRFITDLMYFSQKVPTVPIERRMNLAPLVAARQMCEPRPGWCAIFTQAFARVAARRPGLRRSYLQFPWPHLYEHGQNVASVVVERRLPDEDVVFIANLQSPENRSLPQIDAFLRRCKERPVGEVGAFRRILRMSRLPRPLRHWVWWWGLNVSGRARARFFGTFGVSATGGSGAALLTLWSPLSVTLSYGMFAPDGSVDVRLMFDHRVLDGAPMARALVDLEEVLLGEVLAEVQRLRHRQAA